MVIYSEKIKCIKYIVILLCFGNIDVAESIKQTLRGLRHFSH